MSQDPYPIRDDQVNRERYPGLDRCLAVADLLADRGDWRRSHGKIHTGETTLRAGGDTAG